MPEDSKKNQQKGKNDPKEQRKPRRSGYQHKEAHAEKKFDRKTEDQKSTPKVIVPQKPPVYETPGPEFYQSLKRETDEILKITEEENAKYKKKEIQSNWSKYEMPIETYDDMEEQENLGADYEKLIQAPLSVGGHFQFKHEKSWDITTAPSLYDKYFDINMDNLSLALSTIPFYERNVIDQSVFTQTDIQTMNNRSTRFKQKYYNDKSYTTPELDAQDKILNNLKENLRKPEDSQEVTSDNDDVPVDDNKSQSKDIDLNSDADKVDEKAIEIGETSSVTESQVTKLEFKSIPKTEAPSPVKINKEVINTDNLKISSKSIDNKLFDLDDIILEKEINPINEVKKIQSVAVSEAAPKVVSSPVEEPKKDPVIESPEDLEKWLDDFLDG